MSLLDREAILVVQIVHHQCVNTGGLAVIEICVVLSTSIPHCQPETLQCRVALWMPFWNLQPQHKADDSQ
jgi:hypothetical protein